MGDIYHALTKRSMSRDRWRHSRLLLSRLIRVACPNAVGTETVEQDRVWDEAQENKRIQNMTSHKQTNHIST